MTVITKHVLLIFALSYAAFSDHKTRRIPLLIYPVMIGITSLLYVIEGIDMIRWIDAIIGAVALFAVFYLIARIKTGSGGDALLMGTIGFCAGAVNGCIITLISILVFAGVVVIKALLKKSKALLKEEYPFAPAAFWGYIIWTIILIVR